MTSFWIWILHLNFKEMLMRTRGTINSSSESAYQTISKIEAKIVLATMLEGKNIISYKYRPIQIILLSWKIKES